MSATTHLQGMSLGALLALCASSPLYAGCAAGPKPVATAAALGKVVVYRNGVAYFERFAEPRDKSLTLTVPADKVDDLLKSLSITDEKSGDALPVSYPILETDGLQGAGKGEQTKR